MNKPQGYWQLRRRKVKPVAQVPAAELANIASDINVRGKYARKIVMALGPGSALTQYEALGGAAGDAWRPTGAPASDITPA